ncbi:MAG: DNA repair protein RecN [Gammaproteobacteria bacterium]|nr:DNA repair protein RecN [Gammaproteobacteria bacterium]
MLSNLHIRNLAIIDAVDLDLTNGMTGLTGETGAGKSILVDALGLALGERADSDAVRPNTDRAEVSASFDLSNNSTALNWLKAQDLDDESGCLVRRIVTAEGRSRGYINGNAVPMQILRKLGEQLVDICGQQAHQSLLRPAVQRSFLDQYGRCGKSLKKVRTAHAAWQQSAAQLDALSSSDRDRAARLELLRYQVQELTALDPKQGELESLNIEHSRAGNAAKIAEGVSSSIATLYENEDSAQGIVGRTRQQIESLANVDASLKPVNALLEEAEIQITEAVDSLRHHLDTIDTDPQVFQQLENRLSALHDQARKHRIEPEQLPQLFEDLQQELDTLDNPAESLEQLEANTKALHAALCAEARKLSTARNTAAKKLSAEVTANIRLLGMQSGSFAIQLTEIGDTPSIDGFERIEYQVALNPGIQPGSLSKVASGGELSRVSLAIQVAARSSETVDTLIFDEVDSGVGGAVAETVGEQLHSLADNSQVICVTHLPQVASQADHQLKVSKLSDGKTTRTQIKMLTTDERVEEIARMLGGNTITDATRAHACEMLDTGSQQSGKA